MKPVASDVFRKLDRTAIQDYFIPGLLLMENAGRAVSDAIARDFPPCRVLIFVGKGNNGGDGFVVARHLVNRGYPVQILLLTDPSQLKEDPLLNFRIVGKMGIPTACLLETVSQEAVLAFCQNSEVMVDAIFGIGICKPVRGIFETAIRAINLSGKKVYSIDVPSGLDADTGRVHGVAVRATKTVTLALPKTGLFEGEGPDHAGAIEVADIGLPNELLVPFLD